MEVRSTDGAHPDGAFAGRRRRRGARIEIARPIRDQRDRRRVAPGQATEQPRQVEQRRGEFRRHVDEQHVPPRGDLLQQARRPLDHVGPGLQQVSERPPAEDEAGGSTDGDCRGDPGRPQPRAEDRPSSPASDRLSDRSGRQRSRRGHGEEDRRRIEVERQCRHRYHRRGADQRQQEERETRRAASSRADDEGANQHHHDGAGDEDGRLIDPDLDHPSIQIRPGRREGEEQAEQSEERLGHVARRVERHEVGGHGPAPAAEETGSSGQVEQDDRHIRQPGCNAPAGGQRSGGPIGSTPAHEVPHNSHDGEHRRLLAGQERAAERG